MLWMVGKSAGLNLGERIKSDGKEENLGVGGDPPKTTTWTCHVTYRQNITPHHTMTAHITSLERVFLSPA